MKPPVELEIAGRPVRCEYGQVEAHVYRNPEDAVFNHLEVNEYGTQRVYAFDCAAYIMYLSGVPLPDTPFDKKEIKHITSEMDREVGWNCDLIIRDECPEDIKERYIRLSTVALKGQVYVPTDW
jgi:hypothetical protein